MKKYALISFLVLLPLSAQRLDSPKHMIGISEPLTAASTRPAREIALEYVRGAADQLGLNQADLAGLYLAKEYQTAHNGVTHLIYQQQFQGIDVLNAEWVVNIDREGRVLNAGGNLYTGPGDVTLPPLSSSLKAVRSAVREVNPSIGQNYAPFEAGQAARKNGIRFAGGAFAEDIEGELVWYAVRGVLRPAWLFYITDEDKVNSYATVVDDASQAILTKRPMTFFQSAARGLVFERESPQPNPNPGVRLTAAPPLAQRTLQPFTGDPTASPRGWVTAGETAGNNVVAGENLLGTRFLTTPTTAKSGNGDFSFTLQLGAGMPNPINFADAATTNLFYWMNRAHDLHYQNGFDEAAGNFQQENFGRGGVGGDPVYAFSHFGAAALGRGQVQNAFFSVRGTADGGQPMVAMYLSAAFAGDGDFFTDGSYDSFVMIHEYTHGVSFRLVRQGYNTFQGAAMGEAWSDFFGLEYTLPDSAPPDGVYPSGEYFDQTWGIGGGRTRPYSTKMEINPLTFANIGHVIPFPEVHADGEIWFEALWDMRANLIQQFGAKEGRRRLRLLVIDGMKLSPPAPSMVDMRDAILLADRVDFKGASQDQIWAAFAKRGLGALAYSSSGDTVHIIPSFDLPSTTGAMRFYDDPLVLGETARIVLQDANYTQPTVRIQMTGSSGDVENVILRRTGSLYTGAIGTSANTPVSKFDDVLSLVPGDAISAYYVDENAGGQPRLIQTTINTMPGYSSSTTPQSFAFANERALNVFGTFSRVDLPIQFPFFSKKYSSVLVHQNGLLTFDLPVFTPCTDSVSLPSLNGIAPLWANLTILGDAQPRENVYMSQAPGSVTFRWAGETRTVFAAPGDPVNFAATLFEDGRIQFQYGSGNKNLSALTFSGCGPGPVVGISNGHGTFSQSYLLNTYENFATFHLDPPFNFSSIPVAKVESPAPDQRFKGVLQVTGVAYDSEAFISRVDIYIDGVQRARAATGVARPDFCAGQNVRGCPNVGFAAPLNIASLGLSTGAHTLRVRVTNSRGAQTDSPDAPIDFFVDAGQSRIPYGKIESPSDGDEVSGRVAIRGYVVADDLRILSVDTLIDGITYGPTLYNQLRNDICTALSPRPPNCPNVGFMLTLSTLNAFPPVPDGKHSLQIRARDETGRFTMIPEAPITITVNNGAAVAVIGVLTSPKSNEKLSGTVHISGYAYSPGRRITTGIVLVDGDTYGAVRLGEARAAECAGLPDVAACPNIGFSFDLDTNRLLNGPHILGIFLRNDRGDFVVIPNLVNGGINIFVEN